MNKHDYAYSYTDMRTRIAIIIQRNIRIHKLTIYKYIFEMSI